MWKGEGCWFETSDPEIFDISWLGAMSPIWPEIIVVGILALNGSKLA